jgi:hypothetical protein
MWVTKQADQLQLGVIMHGYSIALMSSLHLQKSLGGPLRENN